MSSGEDFSDDDWGAKPLKKAPAKKATTTKSATSKAATTGLAKPRSTAAAKSKASANAGSIDGAGQSVPVPKLTKAASSGLDAEGRTIEEIYQKKTQLEHILLRPDTYIGSTEKQTINMWVYEDEAMVHRPVTYVPGLYKIFDEIIVNAADNKVRDSTMDTIKVTIDKENNEISVWNNGRGIPVEIHAKEQVYVPELIFGHLLTSSNYDDDQKKITGGRNGYGAKLCNIFSTEFTVETADSGTGRKFKQSFFNNMSDKSKHHITDNPRGEDYTKITFKPDLAKFGMLIIDDDFEALVKKRAYDLAGCVSGVKVFLNGDRLKLKGFKDYVDLYLKTATHGLGASLPVVFETPNARWEVGFSLSDGQFQQVSFVNSICTMKGGTHVNHVADQIVSHLIEGVKKKDKKAAALKPFQVKNHIWVFVNCHVENPTFDSQTKENMTLRQSAFGSKCDLSEEFFKKVLKSGVLDNVLSFAKFQEDKLLKKTDGSKKQRITGNPKLADANNAGTRNGKHCTLILTEGDSAKSLAITGLSIVGRDNFGVFPLRGKLLNVREANHAQITANAEINAIKQILGLQHGKVYESVDSLRYGHLMIMTDQDHDGSHIKGLIINFLDHFWPSLLKIPGFLLEFITPIVKATKGNKQHGFFTIPEYESWKKAHDDGKGWTIKYYKGLGTSSDKEALEYFSDLDKHRKSFGVVSDQDRALIDMAFSKKKADDRKEWLRNYQPGTYMDHSQAIIPLDDFINRELILFSMSDNARSIPCVVDGLKPGQRKILWSCFKRNLKNEIKVAQLAGYVSEHSAYHHGEQSLCSTIVGMAQNFVGSNNINLLMPNGAFGTRLQGGKDASSPRYIFTQLTPLTRALFPAQDHALLTYLNDDGLNVEPEWYTPIIPMLLVNGGDGIGTGWSSSIPCYNPRDLVENIHRMMDGHAPEPIHPWYSGFKGTIELVDKDKYRVTGIINKIDATTVEITELPIHTWTQSYKEDLEKWLQTDKVDKEKGKETVGWIKDYKEYHTDKSVHFVITLTEENMEVAEKEGLEKKFKLTSTISTTNLVCFDKEGRLRKYDSVLDILQDWYALRRSYYQKRKAYLLNHLNNERIKCDNKVRFVTEIIKGQLTVQNKKRNLLLQELKDRGYDTFYKGKTERADAGGDDAEGEAEEEQVGGNGYDYLLSMPIWNLTMEKVQKLQKEQAERAQEVEILSRRTIDDLWRTDLDEFLALWDATEMEREQEAAGLPAGAKKAGLKAVKRAAPAKVKSIKEETFDFDEQDDDDDFMPAAPKPAGKPKAVRKPAVKKELTVSPPPEPQVASQLFPPKTQNIDQLAESFEDISISSMADAAKKRVLGTKKPTQTGTLKAKTSRAALQPVADNMDVDDFGNASVEPPAPAAKAKAPPKPRAPRKAPSKAVTPSGDDEFDIDSLASMDPPALGVANGAKAAAKKAPAKAPAKPRAKAINAADAENAPPPAAVTAKPRAAPKKTTKKMVISDSEEEDEEVVAVPSVVAKGRPARAGRGRVAVSYAEDDDDVMLDIDDGDGDFRAGQSDSDF
ncbi:DNA topoisomerase 2 [Rhizophlyctis rosea]|uniref:DNA topoisomerase 2 n=1 Tax=Rhizophlyctis rosea TaxID=64517 RepID=A0AAD5X4C9_9FUNG|nr:DNA topoisomerase 2 [Rhizophlyctis rosea]